MNKNNRHEIAMALQDTAGPIYITSHNSPDGDAIGSMLGLTWALKAMGKTVYPVLIDDVPNNLLFLPGTEWIQKPDSVGVPDEGVLVSVDVSGRTRMNVPLNWRLPIFIIDHHSTGKSAEGLIWCEPEATATGELIEELIREELNLEMTPEIANCLYLAIASDSGFFKYSNTTPKALRLAASLVEAGAEPNFISENFEIRSFYTLTRLAEILKSIEIHWNGWLTEMTIVSLPEDEPGFSDGFVDFPRSISTAQVSVLYKVIDSSTIRISLRSKGPNVASVAEKLGGGGHYRAAGLTFDGTLEEAKEKVHQELRRLMLEE